MIIAYKFVLILYFVPTYLKSSKDIQRNLVYPKLLILQNTIFL